MELSNKLVWFVWKGMDAWRNTLLGIRVES